MKYILYIFVFVSFLKAVDINIEANKWVLAGSPSSTTISQLNLDSEDIIWSYKNGSWYCYKEGTVISSASCITLTSLDAGQAFWAKSLNSKTITINTSSSVQPTLVNGWNFISPTNSNIDIKSEYNSSNINSVWMYENSEWKLWTPTGIHTQTTLSEATTLSLGKGAWVNNSIDGIFTFAGQSTSLVDGNFNNISVDYNESSFSQFEITIQIDTNSLYGGEFNLGIKMNSAEFLLKSIILGSNGVVSQPSKVYFTKVGSGSKTITDNNILTFNNGSLTIDLESAYNQLKVLDPNYSPSMGEKDTVVVSNKQIFKNDKKNTSEIQIASNNFDAIVNNDTSHIFPIGSSMIEGVINLY